MTLIAQSCRRRPWVWGGGAGDLALGRPRLSASWERCRPSHANGAVAEEIDFDQAFDPHKNMVYSVIYAFTAHDRRLVRVARRARTAGGRRVPSITMASQLHRELVADASPSRRAAPWYHAWSFSSHILP